MTDWTQIKNEYIQGALSCRELGVKHGVNPVSVSGKAAREQWARLRREFREGIPEREPVSALQAVADKLLRKIEASVDAEEALDVKDLRALVSALKDLISIRGSCAESEELCEEEAEEAGLRVIFEAGDAEWNE